MRKIRCICLIASGTIVLGLLSGQSLAATMDFDVALTGGLDSKTAKVGQPVTARLVGEIRDGSKLLAPAGSEVSGNVTEVYGSRRLLHAEVSTKRWMRAGAGIGLHFDRIVPPHGAALKIDAVPVAIVGKPDEIGKKTDDGATVSKNGNVEASRKKDLKPKLARTALGVAAFVAGPITAVAGAAAGAIKPSTVLPEASDESAQKHRRLKGMATGAVAGLPGGFLINDSVLKGQQAVLKPGTRITLEWKR